MLNSINIQKDSNKLLQLSWAISPIKPPNANELSKYYEQRFYYICNIKQKEIFAQEL